MKDVKFGKDVEDKFDMQKEVGIRDSKVNFGVCILGLVVKEFCIFEVVQLNFF